MGPKNNKEREAEDITGRQAFIDKIRGPIIVSVFLALVGSGITGFRNNILRDERSSVLVDLVKEEQRLTKVNTDFRLKGGSYASKEAVAARKEALDELIEVRIEIATLKEQIK